MNRSASSRAGSASRSVLLLALLAGAIVLVLALLLRTKTSVGTRDASTATSSDATPAETTLSESAAPARDALAAPAAPAPHVRPVGTRLAGGARLEGRVIDRATGAGVASARVELLPLPPYAATLMERILDLLGLGSELPDSVRPIASTISADDGSFAFHGVRAGSWFVDARGPYHAPEGNVRASALASPNDPPLEVHVVPGGRVLGRVLAPDGQPARSASVFLMGGPGRFVTDLLSGDFRLFEATADSDGAFVFEGVPPGGGYDVSAAGSGFAASHVIGIDVVAHADARVDVHGRTGGSVRGRVVSAGVDGQPSAPIAGAHVAAIPRGIRDLLLVGEVLAATHAVTGDDGAFLLSRVPPGEVDLGVIAPGHLPAFGGSCVVADGATTSAADLVLSKGRQVRGRTVDGAGAPIAGVQVRWDPIEGTRFDPGDMDFAPMLLQKVPGFAFPLSDADGRFEAGPFLGQGSHALTFHKLGWKDVEESVADSALDEELVVVLSHGGSVEGTVVDASDEKPVRSFTIATHDAIDVEAGAPTAANPFTGARPFEDSGGRFRLDAVDTGRAVLRVASPGYASQRIEADVTEGRTTSGLVVRLHAGATVRGVVIDESGALVAGARVVTVDANEKRGRGEDRDGSMLDEFRHLPPPLLGFAVGLGIYSDREGISKADGRFELRGVEPGVLRCRAFHRDFAFGTSAPFAAEAGPTVEGVRVEINRGGGVEGKVRDRNGRPVVDVAVVALAPMAMGGMPGNESMGALYEGRSDDDGRYRIEHVAAGNYFLLATRGDEALHPASFLGRMNLDMVSIPKNEIVRYDLVDTTSGGCRVTGRVLDAGTPVTTGSLMATAAEGNGTLGIDMKMSRVSREGRFEFPGLAPGTWQISLKGGPGNDVRMQLLVPDQAELAVDLNLPDGGLEGTVVDAAGGEPIADAVVRLRPLGVPKAKGLLAMVVREGDERVMFTDEHGAFSFARLCAGEYQIVVHGPDEEGSKRFAPCDPVLVRVEEGRIDRGRVVRLSMPVSMNGIVRGEDGRPIEAAEIRARRQDQPGARSERTDTDSNGRFELTGLAPGVYVVEAREKDHATASVRDVRIGSDAEEAKPVEILLRRGSRVVVIVLEGGRPVSGAHAVVRREEGDPGLEAEDADRILEGMFKGEGVSDGEGRIDLGRFLPGKYRVEITRGDTVKEVGLSVPESDARSQADLELGVSLR